MNDKKLVIAVDFDGTLCETDFPKIALQTSEQNDLMKKLISLRSHGHKIILWTCRGDNEKYPALTEAINWCKERGLYFDAVNENLHNQKKLSGPSPKIIANIYIDDLAANFKDWRNVLCLEKK